ncbi:hypothetical protein BGW38_004684 [Lunasporangiospora selenospora]|uniref:Ion transport domain-containing protein n=1 Tax=Lunasporangiospora selenospora TaxID=979761 RepID=A0A9P6G0P4_9FUNG|nr:hypothetical protein BGW38_004684 [Lunasporangiospora selenospora]
MRDYESNMKTELGNSSYVLDERGVATFHGSSQRYSRPVRLENESTVMFSLESLINNGQLCFAVVCFVFDKDANGPQYIRVFNQELVLETTTIDEISFVRVLLRLQVVAQSFEIHLGSRGNACSESPRFCYVELSDNPPTKSCYDRILPSLPPLIRSISVWHKEDNNIKSQRVPVNILRYAISASGSHAATLSSIGESMYLDLWTLGMSIPIQPMTYPSSSTTPTASTLVKRQDHNPEDFQLSISWNGAQIAVYTNEHNMESSVKLFSQEWYENSAECPATISLCPSQRHSQCIGLQSFRGAAKFTHVSTTEWGDSSERFIACNGESLYIFSTTGQWMLLHTIPLFKSCEWGESYRSLSTVAQGVLVARKSPYRFALWDLESGRRIHLIETKHEIRDCFVSSNGETVAAVGRDQLSLYSIGSGELVQRSDIVYNNCLRFVEGDTGIADLDLRLPRAPVSILSASTLSRKRELLLPSKDGLILQDIRPRGDWLAMGTESTLVACTHGSILEVSFVEDVALSTDNTGEPICNSECPMNPIPLPQAQGGIEVSFSGGTYTMTRGGEHSERLVIDIEFNNGKSGAGKEAVSLYSCRHERTLTYIQDKTIIRLDPERVFALENVTYFLGTKRNEFLSFEDPSPDAQDAFLRYLSAHVNIYPNPQDHRKSIISAICMNWRPWNHTRIECIVQSLLQPRLENNWIPLSNYSSGANPVAIMLERAKKIPRALEIAVILIDYCIEKARNERDITFTLLLLECMDDLVARYPDIALRTTRVFAYIHSHDRQYIVHNHKIAHSPMSSRYWFRDPRKIYHCKNPILQLHESRQGFDPLNDNFTEDVFVAPFSLLWTFIPSVRRPRSEFSIADLKPAMAWPRVLFRLAIASMNPASHVYIRPRNYSLEILDNAAIEALVQYKWNTFVFGFWLARFTMQCIYYLLILIAALMQIYYEEKDSLLGVFAAIIALASVFLWQERLQWRESMSPFNLLDLVMYLYPLGSSIHQILNILQADENAVTEDFSFCIVLVFLHLLAELRISEVVCKYITIVFGILREIRVFFMVFAASVLFFSIAILHILYGVSNNREGPPDASLPNHFFGAISTGGRYDPLESDLYEEGTGVTKSTYKNYPLQVMVMIYFTFSSILMLNVLIALINVAFVKADDSWRQVWLENRLRYVESAENMSYHIPGFREAFDWFPKEIYYTATPYQAKQYWRRIKKKDEDIILQEVEPRLPGKEEHGASLETPLVRSKMDGLEERISLQGESHREDILSIKKGLEQQSMYHKNDFSEQRIHLSNLQKTVGQSQEDLLELKKELSEMKQDIRAILLVLQSQSTQHDRE